MAKRITPIEDLDPDFTCIVYGKAGKGKTTFSASFPKPMLIADAKEKGTSSVRDIKGIDVVEIGSLEEAEDIVNFLAHSDHKYKTASLDTISKIQNMAIQGIMRDRKPDDDKDWGFWGTMTKQDWGAVSSRMRPLISDFRDLPIHSIFVAHERVFNIEDEDDDAQLLPEIGPRLMPSVVDHMNAEASIIVEMFNRKIERKVKIGKRTRVKEKVEYCMRIGPHAIYTTKFRKPLSVTLPDIIVNPTYDELMELVLENGEE